MADIKEKLVELFQRAKGGTIQEWVSVEDRLPEPFVDVLVSVLEYRAAGIWVERAYLTRHNEWVGVPMCGKVTHWMPLPEPPKGEIE